ncbi:MAG: hypothetical protein IJ282_08825 [Lachnospiraceae bacterium]|nr:hypothetical protein [Lachnospiraceae bacterium]
MEAIEIILLIAGIVVFVLSFVIPAKKEGLSEEAKEAARKEVEALISADVTAAKDKINDIVDETVTYSIEKTERSLERMTNEKIMAVNEYADTVLGDINKSHTEVMFLYDMLNEKHQSVKETVSEITRTMKKVETVAEEVATLDSLAEEVSGEKKDTKKTVKETKTAKRSSKVLKEEKQQEEAAGPDLSFMQNEGNEGRNNNERILELHSQGKSNVAIAKELGLGVGEVKLVIGLFEGM